MSRPTPEDRGNAPEAALRGGTIVALLFGVAVLARDALRDPVSRSSALLAASIGACIVEAASGFRTLDPARRIPIDVVTTATPAAFWIAMGRRACSDD